MTHISLTLPYEGTGCLIKPKIKCLSYLIIDVRGDKQKQQLWHEFGLVGVTFSCFIPSYLFIVIPLLCYHEKSQGFLNVCNAGIGQNCQNDLGVYRL